MVIVDGNFLEFSRTISGIGERMEKGPTAHQAVSLAVLPFDNLSGQQEFDYFAKGFVEDLTVDLCHFSGLQIISSYTAERLASGERGELEAARQIPIYYLLKGSIRVTRDDLRITTQLIHTSGADVVWAERFDAPTDSYFELQDSIVTRVVAAISAEVDHNLLAAARKKSLTNLEAYDCWLRGMDRIGLGTLEADNEAREFFNQALATDPHYSRAYAGLSLSHFNEWSCQLWELYEESEHNAFNYALKALQLNDTDHIVQMILGRVYLFRRQFDEAEHHIQRSLDLNSNDADNLVQLATCFTFLGRASEGERLFLKALQLNPYRNLWYYQYGSFTYFVQKHYQTSIDMALKRPLTNVWVDLPGYIAAAYAYLGEKEKASTYLETFIEFFKTSISCGRSPETAEIIDWVQMANPFKYQADSEAIINGLVLAGLEQGRHHRTATISSPAQASQVSSAIFRLEQDVWRMGYDGRDITLTDMKGFHDISRLLAAPEVDIHATELMGSESSMDENDFVLDDQARLAYRKHIEDLQAGLEEAEGHNDLGRKTRLQKELDQVLEHLSQSMGVGNRSRKLKSPAERARSAVTLRIRSAIKKITAHHPALGKHLSNSIRTGVFCQYSPEEDRDWSLH